MPIVTLLTDFGSADEYVGVMKGVILTMASNAVIVDISHQIEPQNISQAAFMLQSAYTYFPIGSIHVIVVDPGVGTERNIVGIFDGRYFFLAPDNGVLTLIKETGTIEEVYRLNNRKYWLKNISRTFHGRDIIAPTAAHLANGVRLNQLGTAVDPSSLLTIELLQPYINNDGSISGHVVAIDRFGNLITSIAENLISAMDWRQIKVRIGNKTIRGIVSSYTAVPQHTPLAIIGSRGYIEISVSFGSAQALFQVTQRDEVTVF